MTSYQAKFASYHTCDRSVGFLLAWNSIGKHNKMSRYFLFSSYCNSKLTQQNIPLLFYLVDTIIPNYNRVTRILAHTHLVDILNRSAK